MNEFDREVYCILGIPFDAMDLKSARERIVAFCRGAQPPVPYFLSTANVNFLSQARTDISFRNSLLISDLCVADGAPVIWVARLLGIPLPERVAGSDLIQSLREEAIGPSPIRVFFFGGGPGVAAKACENINSLPAGIRAVGFYDPGFVPLEEMSALGIMEEINCCEPDFLVVSLGAKKGQDWIVRNRQFFRAKVVSHLGAVVNFFAGTVWRAPLWMQRMGAEWLWRIGQEPSLWRRYAADGLNLAWLLASRVLPYAVWLNFNRLRGTQWSAAMHQVEFVGDGEAILTLRGAWFGENLGPLREVFQRVATSMQSGITLDLAEIEYVDAALIGLIMILYGQIAVIGQRNFRCINVPPGVKRVFYWCGAEFLLEVTP